MNFETCDIETLLLFKKDAENKNDLKQRRLLKILLKKLITEGKTIIKKKTNKNVKKSVGTSVGTELMKRHIKNKVDHKTSRSRIQTASSTSKIETDLPLPETLLSKPPSGPPPLLCVTCSKPFDTEGKHVCSSDKETEKIENPILKIDLVESKISPIEIEITETAIESEITESAIEETGTTPANTDSESDDNNEWFEEMMPAETKTRRIIKKKYKRYKNPHYNELIIFECSICDQDFLIESELDEHIKSHNISVDSVASDVVPSSIPIPNENKILKCRTCEKVLPSKRGLKLHIRSLHLKDNGDEFKCKEFNCNEIFTCKGSLEKHNFQQHKISTKTCHICNKFFSSKHKLQHHIKSVHLRLCTHICPICGKLLLDENSLERHLSSHSDLKPYECDQCPLAFKIKADLTVHLRIHTGERPYLCTVCQRKFTCNSNLHKHMRSHGEYVIVNMEGRLK